MSDETEKYVDRSPEEEVHDMIAAKVARDRANRTVDSVVAHLIKCGGIEGADFIMCQAKRIEEFREERELSRTNGRRLEHTIRTLQAENATLRAAIDAAKEKT